MATTTIEKRIRLAGLLVVTGLIAQMVTMSWSHPLAFMAFLGIGCTLTLAGILLYLVSLSAKR